MDLPASHVWLPEGIIFKSLRVHQQLVNWSFGCGLDCLLAAGHPLHQSSWPILDIQPKNKISYVYAMQQTSHPSKLDLPQIIQVIILTIRFVLPIVTWGTPIFSETSMKPPDLRCVPCAAHLDGFLLSDRVVPHA